MKKHPVLVGVVGGIVSTLLVGIAVWLTIAYTGAYNVAATGMPAFGEHHSPEEIVAIATFVSALPGLSADDYSRLTESARGEPPSEPPAEAAEPPGNSPHKAGKSACPISASA